MKVRILKPKYGYVLSMLITLLILVSSACYSETLGTVATAMTSSMGKLASLIGVGSYVAGLGFAIGAIMKFKQHKDNPTQIPVGTPIALVFIAAALLFLPSLMQSVGDTMFGSTGGKVAGTSGSWTALGGK